MREIKFRAIKDSPHFEFVYGAGIHYDKDGNPRIPHSDGLYTTCLKGTEGQFTWMFCSGKELYDGDILGSEALRCHVEWSDKHYSYVLMFRDARIPPATLNEYQHKLFASKIIGNIHQHPHLLT